MFFDHEIFVVFPHGLISLPHFHLAADFTRKEM